MTTQTRTGAAQRPVQGIEQLCLICMTCNAEFDQDGSPSWYECEACVSDAMDAAEEAGL